MSRQFSTRPRRGAKAVVAMMAMLGALALSAPGARAAGIVTHAWMALDAIDHVTTPDLQALLTAHQDQVRAGAEFPDGGYATRNRDAGR